MRWYDRIPGGPSRLLCPVEKSDQRDRLPWPQIMGGFGAVHARGLPQELKAAWPLMVMGIAAYGKAPRPHRLAFESWSFQMVQWWGLMEGTCLVLNKKAGLIVMSDEGRKMLIVDSGLNTVGGWMRSPQVGRTFTSLEVTRRSYFNWMIRNMGDDSARLIDAMTEAERADTALAGSQEITMNAAVLLPTKLWDMYASWCTTCGVHKKRVVMPFPYMCLASMDRSEASRYEGFTLNGRPGYWCYGSVQRPNFYDADPMKAWWSVRGRMLHKADRIGNNFACDMSGLIWDAEVLDKALQEVCKGWPKKAERDQRFFNQSVWSFWLEEVRKLSGWGVMPSSDYANDGSMDWVKLGVGLTASVETGDMKRITLDTSGRCPAGFVSTGRVGRRSQLRFGIRCPGASAWSHKEDWSWLEVARLCSCGNNGFPLTLGLHLGAWTALGLRKFDELAYGDARVMKTLQARVSDTAQSLDFYPGSTALARLTRWAAIQLWRASEEQVISFAEKLYWKNVTMARLGQMSYVYLSARDLPGLGSRGSLVTPFTGTLRPYATEGGDETVTTFDALVGDGLGASSKVRTLATGVFLTMLEERMKRESATARNGALTMLEGGTISSEMKKWMNDAAEKVRKADVADMVWGSTEPARKIVDVNAGFLFHYYPPDDFTENRPKPMGGSEGGLLDAITLIRRGEGEQWTMDWMWMGFGATGKSGGYHVDGWESAWRQGIAEESRVMAQAASDEAGEDEEEA